MSDAITTILPTYRGTVFLPTAKDANRNPTHVLPINPEATIRKACMELKVE